MRNFSVSPTSLPRCSPYPKYNNHKPKASTFLPICSISLSYYSYFCLSILTSKFDCSTFRLYST